MIQIRMAGKDIGFSQSHGQFAGLCVGLVAGFTFRQMFLEHTAVVERGSKYG
jgi:hypothetical protein